MQKSKCCQQNNGVLVPRESPGWLWGKLWESNNSFACVEVFQACASKLIIDVAETEVFTTVDNSKYS